MKQALVRHLKNPQRRRQASWVLGAMLILALSLHGARIVLVNARAPIHLRVYAFSTQEEIFTQGIFPDFEETWEAETGRELVIEGMFGASGTLANQINLGAPADVALFSNAQHVNWLKVGRRVEQQNQPNIIGCTPMVIVTRAGNPAGITAFADLGQPGLRLLHADPRSSGAGEWTVLAEYGDALFAFGDPARAEGQLDAIWRNMRLLGPSARATLALFELGAGDALVTYEQDARLALERGVELEIVVPPRTIIACHVAVIVDDNVTSAERSVAQAFLNYLSSGAGQQLLNRYHLRPVNDESAAFPGLVHPFTVEDLGGWSRAYNELVEGLWKEKIEPRLDMGATFRLLGTGGP